MKKLAAKMSLSTQIFISLIAGMLVGVIFFYFVPASFIRDDVLVNGVFYLLGNGFIRAMQMLVVPLVFCSLICGTMAIGDTNTLGKVGIKTLGFYLITTAVAITIALSIGELINPGVGLDMESIKMSTATAAEATSVVDTFLNIVPKNPIGSLAEGNMLQIIFFAVLVGIILAKLGDSVRNISNSFNQWNQIMMSMTLMVMKAAPIGVFCLVAKTFSEIGFDGFLPMIKYMLGVLLALGVQCFIVYMIMLKIFAKKSPTKFLKKFFPVMGFAFSTATSNATIPLSIDTLSKKMGVSKKISSFTIPLGATINMDGTAIMQGVAVVFAAQAFGIDLSVMDYVTVIFTATMASIGTAGVPGVGLITLSMVFASVGLPVEAIGIIMGIDRILDMTRTAVNITGDAVCTIIVAKQNDAIKDDVYDNMSEETKEVAA
ncbi:dicarboxylate/amino acid:cation symporter [Candidatus Epulonipiscium viviparus]|uniref:dicarboxylate/amino acid:cation symporter n=1 Tax=Candidatus Epulonipiscium viviparus TaxID=420336 RepID=UPI00049537A3|nr:dicarboxylate/amino acid:cation symporter [Candidatus Epulopiscium viviparus]